MVTSRSAFRKQSLFSNTSSHLTPSYPRVSGDTLAIYMTKYLLASQIRIITSPGLRISLDGHPGFHGMNWHRQHFLHASYTSQDAAASRPVCTACVYGSMHHKYKPPSRASSSADHSWSAVCTRRVYQFDTLVSSLQVL